MTDGTIEIYGGSLDETARADLADHLADVANPHEVTKSQVGLGSVDNTSDADKPVSTATAAALALKAPLASPTLTGTPAAPTATPGTATTQIATTAFAQAAANVAGAAAAAAQADIDAHEADTGNPHGVTKAQVGLSAVDNTADLNKPVSNATQAAINAEAAARTVVAADLADHVADTGNPHQVTKAQIGLGSVDNTADAAKPVSAAQQTAINAVQTASDAVASDLADHAGATGNPHSVTKAQIGLGSVDNTADAAKPVSAATQIALNLKANLASPTFTGTPAAPTAAPGTNTPQLATTAFVTAAGAALQTNIDTVAAAAAAAQTAADGAGADAAQGIADAAAAQAAADAALLGLDHVQARGRPGDGVSIYGAAKTGAPAAISAISSNWVTNSAAGAVVRIDAATAADPQVIAPIVPIAVEPGRIYEIRWRVQRQADPVDPLNDSVTLGLAWLDSSKAGNGETSVVDLALTIADGIIEQSVKIGISASAALDEVAPADTIYCRPYVEMFGDSHITDVITISAIDVTPAVVVTTVNVQTPSSGATITLTDLRPLLVNNSSTLAALTILLPADPLPGRAIEIGFNGEVTALAIEDADANPVATAPTSAYGPGAAILFKYINDAIGWVYWK